MLSEPPSQPASPTTPSLQHQLDEISGVIARCGGDPAPEIQAIVAQKRAQKEELLTQLRASKKLPDQLRMAERARDKAEKASEALKNEVSVLTELLGIKQQAAQVAAREAEVTAQECHRLAALAAQEAAQHMQQGTPFGGVEQVQQAAAALAGQLPAETAHAFQQWFTSHCLVPRVAPAQQVAPTLQALCQAHTATAQATPPGASAGSMEQQPAAASGVSNFEDLGSQVAVTAEIYNLCDEAPTFAPFRGELPTRSDPYGGKGAANQL